MQTWDERKINDDNSVEIYNKSYRLYGKYEIKIVPSADKTTCSICMIKLIKVMTGIPLTENGNIPLEYFNKVVSPFLKALDDNSCL